MACVRGMRAWWGVLARGASPSNIIYEWHPFQSFKASPKRISGRPIAPPSANIVTSPPTNSTMQATRRSQRLTNLSLSLYQSFLIAGAPRPMLRGTHRGKTRGCTGVWQRERAHRGPTFCNGMLLACGRKVRPQAPDRPWVTAS
jgi:hypothetical protein